MAAAGRKPKQGMMFDDWHAVYERLGLRLLSVHGTTKGAKYIKFKIKNARVESGITLENLLPRLQNGRYVLKYRGHVLAVVDGKVLDYGDNPAKTKIQAIYKLDQQAIIFE
jgi:hypothetical protein